MSVCHGVHGWGAHTHREQSSVHEEVHRRRTQVHWDSAHSRITNYPGLTALFLTSKTGYVGRGRGAVLGPLTGQLEE